LAKLSVSERLLLHSHKSSSNGARSSTRKAQLRDIGVAAAIR
jgi:hypothetical protein